MIIRKLISGLLVFVLLFSTAGAAGKFRPASAAEGKRQALDLLMEVGFTSEYGEGMNGHVLWRWEDEIRVYVTGRARAADIKELDSFLMQLAFRVPGLPPISRVKSESEANLVITYTTLKRMSEAVENYEAGSWAFFTFWTNDSGAIYKAQIAIAADKANQKARYHLLKEELVGALGLANDHLTYTDSILYENWTTTRSLSDVDWLMLNLLYSPAVSVGMEAEDAFQALRVYIGE